MCTRWRSSARATRRRGGNSKRLGNIDSATAVRLIALLGHDRSRVHDKGGARRRLARSRSLAEKDDKAVAAAAAAAAAMEEPEYEQVVARIDQTLGLLQRALVVEDAGASERLVGRVSSPQRRPGPSPKQRQRQQLAAAGSARKGGASTLDASAYAAAHVSPAARPTRRGLGSPRRQLRSPRGAGRSLASPAGGGVDYRDARLAEERRPSFGTSAGRFQPARSEGPGPAAYCGACDFDTAQRTFGTLALASPERQGRLASPSRSARVSSPSQSARVGSPSRSARIGSPSRSARISSPGADTDMIAAWWEAHRALTKDLWGPGAQSSSGEGGSTDPSGRALGTTYLGLYGVRRRTAVRAHIKLSSAVVGSLNPGVVVEVLEARVLVRGGRNGDGPRVHVRLRSRYGKSSMAICGWACLATPDGHTLLERLPDGGQQAKDATSRAVKQKQKKKKKKRRKKKRASTVALSAVDQPELGSSASDGSLSGRPAQHDSGLFASQTSYAASASDSNESNGSSGNDVGSELAVLIAGDAESDHSLDEDLVLPRSVRG